MPVGKVAAQVGHAIQYMMEDINNLMYIDEWQKEAFHEAEIVRAMQKLIQSIIARQ